MIQDVTDRKQAEAAARRERDRFQAIFDAVVDGIFVVEIGTGRLIGSNASARRMFVYVEAETSDGRLNIGEIRGGLAPYTLARAVEIHKDIVIGDTRVFEWRRR